MKKIKIFDTTLRDGEQSPGCSMNIEQKKKVAKKLDEMGVDIIEAGFAASSTRDFQAIKEVSKIVKNARVVSLARCNKKDIDIAYESIKNAKNPGLHVFIATSELHMKYKLGKTKDEVKEMVKEMVKYAKTKCEEIEFSLEDATRSNRDFIYEIIDIAINNGATTINIPDTVGYTTPEEFMQLINDIQKNSQRIKEVDISVHCHNDLGLATANSLSAIKAGVTQVECTINGIGERAGNTALEEIVAALDTRKDYFHAQTKIDTTKIFEISQLVQEVTGSRVQNNKAIVGANAFLHEAGIHQDGVISKQETYEIMKPERYGIHIDNIVLGIHSGKNAVIAKMKELHYDIAQFSIEKIIEDIKKICETKPQITKEELIEVIENNSLNH